MSSPHVKSVEYIDFDRKTENQVKSNRDDNISLIKKINGWNVSFGVFENGRISIDCSRTIGRLNGAGQTYGLINQNTDLGEA